MSRRDWVLLVVIVLTALGLRLIYLAQLRQNPRFDQPIMDEAYHDQWARAIVEGKDYIEGPYFRAPLYPFFLAAVYRVCGPGYLAPRLIQSVIGALNCGLLFVIGWQCFGRGVAALAGFAAATYWTLIYFDNELLLPVLEVFLDLALAGVLLRAGRRSSAGVWTLAGLLFGLSAITRPNVLLFLPVVLGWMAWMKRWNGKCAAVHALMVLASCAVVIAPVTLRNWIKGRDCVLISSQGGVNFHIGNNPQSDGMAAIVPGTPGDWWGGYHGAIALAENAAGRRLRPSEVSRYYFGEGLRFMREQPRRAAALLLRKLFLFWNRWEIPNNKDAYFWTQQFTPMVRWLPLSFGLIAPLGLLGVVLYRGRWLELFPLWGFVLVYMASVVIFFVNDRFRVPILPPLILLAAYAAVWCWQVVAQWRWKDMAGAVAVLGALALFVNVTHLRAKGRPLAPAPAP